MCGIAGFIDFSFESSHHLLIQMIKSLRHRGPDGCNAQIFESQYCRVGLAHSRLAIIDLTSAAAQPMSVGDLWIIFNGEIYNYKELQAELKSIGYRFTSNSDTEVILHAFLEWGISAVTRFIGMFAFCVYDQKRSEIYLVRDRTGIKPLYFYEGENTWLFGSELKSFFEYPAFDAVLNPQQVFRFFQVGVVSDDQCIYSKCRQIGAGEILTIDLNSRSIRTEKYWRPEYFYSLPKLDTTFEDSVDQLDDLFRSACEYRMVADVPVGVFLSGGYDSSAVAGVLQSNRSDRLKTFTIGFQLGNNEAPVAKQIADYLGTDHTELYCTEREAQDIVTELPYIYDEPFSDSSAIPTILVSRLARRSVKVALSADGGDELFGGYKTYEKLLQATNKFNFVPIFVKNFLRHAVTPFSKLLGKRFIRAGHLADVYCRSFDKSAAIFGQRLHFNSRNFPSYNLSNIFSNDFLRQTQEECQNFHGWKGVSALGGAILYDYGAYLKDDILVKVDRASMSASLEGREPILDHRLFEFSARVPDCYKISSGRTKLLLRSVAHRYVPEHLLNRPKAGFSVPINHWLRNGLSSYLRSYCNAEQLQRTGIFNVDFLNRQLKLFEEDRLFYSSLVWRLVIFQSWFARWNPRVACS